VHSVTHHLQMHHHDITRNPQSQDSQGAIELLGESDGKAKEEEEIDYLGRYKLRQDVTHDALSGCSKCLFSQVLEQMCR